MVALTNKAFESRGSYRAWHSGSLGTNGNRGCRKPNHPLYDEFRALRIESLGHDYAEQKELLDELHENDWGRCLRGLVFRNAA